MATEPHATFGDLLRHARRTAGLTQEALAERAGVSTRAVSNLERGTNRSPRRDTLEMLAQALHLSPEELAQWERARKRLATRAAGAPSSRAADGHPSGHYLPSPLTSFIGRDDETTEVTDLLRRPGIRLLTLTGAGGIGKTRLGINVAEALKHEFPDGVFFVPLAPLAHPSLIPTTIIEALGVREAPGQTPLQGLSTYAQGRSMLLMLDNVEHVVSGATFVGTLLEECPGLKALATSRVPLRIRGEREYPLRALSEDAAATLFIARSRDVKPGFDVDHDRPAAIAEICRRLDGLPLAIELAAARSKMLPPQALLRRLEHPLDILTSGPRDLPGRQHTLRATIAWSYDLLDPAEQELFQALSVFMDGFTLEAAETVGEQDVFEALTALVESNLVEQHEEFDGEPRFRMLETIREFGLEKLVSCGAEAAARERHARYVADLVAAAPPLIMGPEQIYWLDQLETEHANIRAALDWFLERDVEAGLRMLERLWCFWWIRMPLTVGRQYFDRFLERADDTIEPAVMAAALTGAGVITEFESDLAWDRAVALHEQALSIWLDLRDPPEGAHWSYLNLGGIADRKGNLQEAERLYLEAMEYARRHNQPIGRLASLLLLGNLAYARGQLQEAMQCYRDGLGLAQTIGDPWAIASHSGSLGRMLMLDGRYDEARPLLEEALELNRAMKSARLIAVKLADLADLNLGQGRPAEAAALYSESLAEAQRINDTASIGFAQLGLGRAALELGDTAQALDQLRQSILTSRSAGEHTYVASAVEGLAAAHVRTGNARQAAQLYAWADAFRDRLGIHRWRLRQREVEHELVELRAVLPPAAFDAAWDAGTRLTLDQVCEEHLG